MKLATIALILLGSANGCHPAEPTSPLKVTLHDSHGLTQASAPDHRLELILFADHTHMHVRLSNSSDETLTLWKPFCPEGDDAILLEFRESAHPERVLRASPGWGYTAAMGFPKAFGLAPHDDLIVNINFVSDVDWIFPTKVAKDARLDMEVRVGYRSQNLTEDQSKRIAPYPVAKVWEGEVVGKWQPITIINRSGKTIPLKTP